MLRQFLVSGFIVSAGILLGRLSGLGREIMLGSTLGVSTQADIAVLLLTIPDFLISILVGGAMTAALIPTFKKIQADQAKALFYQATLMVLGLFLLVAFILSYFAHNVLALFAPGFTEEVINQCVYYFRLGIWVIPLSAIASVTTAYLQSKERFLVPALGTLLFNTTLIVILMIGSRMGAPLWALTLAIILGAGIRWLSQFLITGLGFEWKYLMSNWLIDGALFKRYVEILGAGGILLVLPTLIRAFASYYDSGSLATVNYSLKLVALPLGVCITVFSIVLLPTLSSLFANPGTYYRGERLAKQATGLVTYLVNPSYCPCGI